MKFKIKTNYLQQIIAQVIKGISSKTPAPNLMGIYVDVKEDGITFISTNKELSIRVVVEASDKLNIVSTGTALIPGKYFAEIVKKIEDEEAEINMFESSSIKINTERSTFTLNLLDHRTYPIFSFDGEGEPIKFNVKELKKIVKQTAFAASTNANRMILTGINFELDNNYLQVMATDSYRLSKKETTLPQSYEKQNIIIPATSLSEFNKILDLVTDKNSQAEVLMYLSQNRAIFKYENVTAIIRLIEGVYPNLKTSIPKEFNLLATFDRNKLISTVERAGLLLTDETDKGKMVTLSFNTEKEVKISSKSSGIGNTVEAIIPYFVSESMDFSVTFDLTYFLEGLKAFETDLITLKFGGEIKPFIVDSEEDPTLLELILPIPRFN